MTACTGLSRGQVATCQRSWELRFHDKEETGFSSSRCSFLMFVD